MKIVFLLSLFFSSIFLYLTNFFSLSFILSFFSLIILSTYISNYTKTISDKIGDKIGGLINSTAGNLPELIISLFAINHNMSDLIKTGLIGSIIGNMLLVLGLSIFFGGIKYKEQSFNKNIARTNFSLLFLALTSLIISSTISFQAKINKEKEFVFSLLVAVILIIIYLLGLIFSLITHKNLFVLQSDDFDEVDDIKSKQINILAYLSIFFLIFLQSKILIDSLDRIIYAYNLSEKLLGVLIMPAIGNVAEYLTAINMSLKNKVNLCIEIAVGSSMQIALFVLPLIVILAYIFAEPVTLVYCLFDLVILILSITLSFFVFQDGKTYWLEGAILLATYTIILLSYSII